MNIASLIFRPDLRFLALTSFQSFRRPSLSFGSSSRISLRRQPFSVSRPRLRPPGNIHNRSRLLLTNKIRPRFIAMSFDDFAITVPHRLTTNLSCDSILYGVPLGKNKCVRCPSSGTARSTPSSDWFLAAFSASRYSDVLKSSGVIWDDRSLNGWLTEPDAMVPDNEMPSGARRRGRSGANGRRRDDGGLGRNDGWRPRPEPEGSRAGA